MKDLTTAAEAKATTALGTEPIIIIKIEWDSGTKYYSEKTFTLGALSVEGKIISFNPIQALQKTDSVGEATGAAVVLDDTDGALKTLINTEIIEGKAVTVYQHFEGNAQADLTLLLKGKIAGGIGWSEGERTLDISIDTAVEDKEVGFAPDETDIPTIYPPAVEKVWPLCFGTVIHVPAIRVLHNPDAELVAGINQNNTSFVVKGGDLFPQTPTVITLDVGNVRYTGTMDGEEFTVVTSNTAHDSTILFLDRPSDDPHADDAKVAWISGDHDITGLYCYANTSYGFAVNKCIRQEGNKCFFLESWGVHYVASDPRIVTHVVMGLGDSIVETAGIPRGSWAVSCFFENINFPITVLETGELISRYLGVPIVIEDKWQLHSGMSVDLVTDYENTYVCNLLPSTEILAVYGRRKIGDGTYLVPIPSTYYTKNLSDSLGGETPTTLEFTTPLEDRAGENWEDDVYVSLRSSVGTNVADIIRWLVETYTNLTCDTTFDSVAGKIGIYPANFAVFDQPNVLKLIEEIAWQARCAVFIRNGVISINYLSELKVADETVDESLLEFKTLELGFTDTDDIVTKLVANWKKDYSGDEKSDRRVVYKNNIDVFDLHEEERDFFIYNNGDLAKLSAYWWGYRYSNSWRKVGFKAFLDTLALDIFDIVAHDIGVVSTNTLRGTVEDISQDSDEHALAYQTQLASKAGDSDSGQPIEDQDYFLGDPTFPVDPWNNPITVPDPGAGYSEVDYTVPPETDDDDPTKPPEPAQNDLRFITYPELVERGTAFQVRVEVRDSNNNLVTDANLTASLQLSTSGSDTLSSTSISIVGGVYEGNLTISGGSGQQSGALTVTASGYNPDSTETFDIVATLSTLTFAGTIPNVTRGAAQSAISPLITGGSGVQTLNVQLNSSDSNDKLYDSGGTEITTLDSVAGVWSLPANWYISGGQGSVVNAQLIFTDKAQKLYNDLPSNQFNITGGTSVIVQQSISLSQDGIGNAQNLRLIMPDAVFSQYPFELGVEVLDSDGNIDTDFDAEVNIDLVDEFGDPLTGLVWASGGPFAQVQGSRLVVTLVDGEWSYDECMMLIPDGESRIGLSAEAADDSRLWDSELVDVVAPYFAVYIDTEIVERGTSYDMIVIAYKPDGTVDTDYEPINDPTITLLSGDPSDVISPTAMGLTGWIDGSKTVSISISGGSSVDETEIEVKETTRFGREKLIVVATTGYSSKLHTRSSYGRYEGQDAMGPIAGDQCSAQGQQDYRDKQNGARTALLADTTIVPASADFAAVIQANGSLTPNYNFNCWSFIQRYYFIINNTDRDNAKAAQLLLSLRGGILQAAITSFTTRMNFWRLRVGYSYVSNGYASGGAFYTAISGVKEWSVAELNQILTEKGTTPGSFESVDLSIPVSWVNNMPGTAFYVWMGIIFNTLNKDLAYCLNKTNNLVCDGSLNNLKTIW